MHHTTPLTQLEREGERERAEEEGEDPGESWWLMDGGDSGLAEEPLQH